VERLLPTFDLKTYQDVKKNLSWAGAGVLWLVALVVYLAVLPPAHREAVNLAAARIPEWASVSVLVVFTVAAGLLFGVLMIHDDFYDAYVIRWRERYDLNFLLPALLAPLARDVDPAFWSQARAKRNTVMRRVFYPFTRDRDGAISENTRVRFYERVTYYWITQIIEMGLLVLVGIALVYWVVYAATNLDPTTLLPVLIGAVAAFGVNRVFRRHALRGVETATREEIAEIHEEHRAVLEKRVRDLHEELGLAYGRHAATT
jgi:hypothetical protein